MHFLFKWFLSTIFIQLVISILMLIGYSRFYESQPYSLIEVFESFLLEPIRMIIAPVILGFLIAQQWQVKSKNK